MDEIFRKHVKKFFSFPGVAKAVEEENFDEVFKAWNNYRYQLRKQGLILDFQHLFTYELCSFLEEAGIDWLSLVTKIPDFAFWYYPDMTVEIPLNIKEFGAFCFKNSSIDTIIYEGTKEDWSKIKLKIDSLLGKDNKLIKIICSNGEYKRRFQL